MTEFPGDLQAGATGEAVSGDLLDLLEARTRDLVERYKRSKQTVEELRAQVRERDRRLGELTERARTLERKRVEARKRVQKMIEQIERLERLDRLDRTGDSPQASRSAASGSPTKE
jgi:cell division septum initiation protein DivIVA